MKVTEIQNKHASSYDIENVEDIRFAQCAIGTTGTLYHVLRLKEGACLVIDGRQQSDWFETMADAREAAYRHNSRGLLKWELAP